MPKSKRFEIENVIIMAIKKLTAAQDNFAISNSRAPKGANIIYNWCK